MASVREAGWLVSTDEISGHYWSHQPSIVSVALAPPSGRSFGHMTKQQQLRDELRAACRDERFHRVLDWALRLAEDEDILVVPIADQRFSSYVQPKRHDTGGASVPSRQIKIGKLSGAALVWDFVHELGHSFQEPPPPDYVPGNHPATCSREPTAWIIGWDRAVQGTNLAEYAREYWARATTCLQTYGCFRP